MRQYRRMQRAYENRCTLACLSVQIILGALPGLVGL